ncbi:DUF4097 family beta strand repeat-containing protein [Pseudonocardia oroxyli]|uniref:Putative adhesin n=1 Tax=Pseudonocardia oroxyli TaxID=366584 RepID=A0A1G7K4Q6_PSEOR|nr:DUF4097 family beta strand repeat-containing protein [Pseudonocardia oroxyli]SDF32116.1 Putative adhesin [Pseudonocardia oroxyli]
MSEREDVRRQDAWPCAEAAELEIGIDVGRVRVELNESATEVRAEVRHDPHGDSPWEQGLTGILTWLGNASGDAAVDPGAAAVRAAEVRWDAEARRLVIRSTQDLPLRVVPLSVTVWAPAGSRLAVKTGAGDVSVSGRAGWAAIRTGSGTAEVDEITGAGEITTGSGRVELGIVGGDAKLRTGSGGVSVASLNGSTQIKAGSGDVTLGEVHGDLTCKTGSGDVVVADAHAGRFDLTTGSGGLRIGVHAGVAAELDLFSGSGSARSDLDVGGVAPVDSPPLHITGRTGSGDVLVTRAATAGV